MMWRLAVCMLAAGCTSAASDLPSDIGGGEVRVHWDDGDTVDIALSVPGTARWCEDGRWLELSAVRSDTGIMLALFPAESLVMGDYPVARPVRTESMRQRPAATLGVRWFTPGLVAGYRAWNGSVAVTAIEAARGGGRTISGRLEASAAAVAGAEGTIAVGGEFTGVPVEPADSGCGL